MSDIALVLSNSAADIVVSSDDLLAESGLQTAIVLSLFCDRRADSVAELPPGETDLRGWWGDAFADVKDRIGSKLWLLWREKRTAETLRRAQQYCEQALAWLTGDGVASQVQVQCSWQPFPARPYDYLLGIEVMVVKPDGTRESYRYEYQWNKQFERAA